MESSDDYQDCTPVGGPIQRDRLFFFGYYEGFRNRQDITTSAVVPSLAERSGDFSGLGQRLLNFGAGVTPIPAISFQSSIQLQRVFSGSDFRAWLVLRRI